MNKSKLLHSAFFKSKGEKLKKKMFDYLINKFQSCEKHPFFYNDKSSINLQALPHANRTYAEIPLTDSFSINSNSFPQFQRKVVGVGEPTELRRHSTIPQVAHMSLFGV